MGEGLRQTQGQEGALADSSVPTAPTFTPVHVSTRREIELRV